MILRASRTSGRLWAMPSFWLRQTFMGNAHFLVQAQSLLLPCLQLWMEGQTFTPGQCNRSSADRSLIAVTCCIYCPRCVTCACMDAMLCRESLAMCVVQAALLFVRTSLSWVLYHSFCCHSCHCCVSASMHCAALRLTCPTRMPASGHSACCGHMLWRGCKRKGRPSGSGRWGTVSST